MWKQKKNIMYLLNVSHRRREDGSNINRKEKLVLLTIFNIVNTDISIKYIPLLAGPGLLFAIKAEIATLNFV